jgi:hypothetical protein
VLLLLELDLRALDANTTENSDNRLAFLQQLLYLAVDDLDLDPEAEVSQQSISDSFCASEPKTKPLLRHFFGLKPSFRLTLVPSGRNAPAAGEEDLTTSGPSFLPFGLLTFPNLQ